MKDDRQKHDLFNPSFLHLSNCACCVLTTVGSRIYLRDPCKIAVFDGIAGQASKVRLPVDYKFFTPW